jgi:elongation factor P--beta-lysine ligase
MRAREFVTEFDPSGYRDRYSLYMDDYSLGETFADLEDAIEAVEAYKRDDPKSQYSDYNIRDINNQVVWRNDAWQDYQKPGKIQFLPPRKKPK